MPDPSAAALRPSRYGNEMVVYPKCRQWGRLSWDVDHAGILRSPSIICQIATGQLENIRNVLRRSAKKNTPSKIPESENSIYLTRALQDATAQVISEFDFFRCT
ncbi:hypothetical protein NECAME_09811 [Necator americanus]|uniref:Uncharacterized protein n=1 Tax=Necator americanus TaxID=51031 RepID=W2TCX1_NECAM|nr:hypothetical protein NECAME_09811 [Necator americanus]ETN79444.1 hypothetical protein NECAME_09811 [Necator americanus]